MMMPIYADMLRMQAIELNDTVRRSAYSFQLSKDRIRLFPIPDGNNFTKVYFDYILKADRSNPLKGSTGTISDYSNVPYDNMVFAQINDVGKQWIRKYGLALSKELLGTIRGKYGTIPIPNSDVALDGDTLRSEAAAEKETLTTQLREMLEQTSRKAMLEADKDEAEFLQEKLRKVPYPIYIG